MQALRFKVYRLILNQETAKKRRRQKTDLDLIFNKHHVLEECVQAKAKRHEFLFFVCFLRKMNFNDHGYGEYLYDSVCLQVCMYACAFAKAAWLRK